jgi:hypothetical protein
LDHSLKTTELIRFRVGDGPRLADVIVSTIKEAENVVPLLLGLKKKTSRAVNVRFSGYDLLSNSNT